MFGWLANLLVKSSVVGSGCACCESQKEQLKKMQQAILQGDVTENTAAESCSCSHGHCDCENKEQCQCEKNKVETLEMKMSYHYKI